MDKNEQDQFNELKSFVRIITLDLQRHREKTPEQLDQMFQRAYHLYVKYDVEGRRATYGLNSY